MDDKIILTTEQDYQTIQAELNAGKKPSKTLRFMVQALENYRQARKYGWSRPWNKYGVVNFQSFRLNDSDAELRQLAVQVIMAEWPQLPDAPRHFIDELLNSATKPLGFIFFQEYTDNGQRFEGVVVSYGRINKDSRRHRDRLDLILESPVSQGISTGLARLRIYADPFNGVGKEPLWQGHIDKPIHPDTQRLFAYLADLSWVWAEDKSRIWQHWITDYIDYFGPRQWVMQKSYFHIPGNSAARAAFADTPYENEAA